MGISNMRRLLSISILFGCFIASGLASPSPGFDVFEKSILELQAAQSDGTTSSRRLVEMYLARIKAYNQAGPALNAIVTLNPRALEAADILDRERAAGHVRGPLHGIPILVKDNYDTVDMPTSDGTLALATLQPTADAFQVQRLRKAGAVILGKTTMHELAAGITTISSLTGATRNPYDPRRGPGGSSGGTAAAVAASFAAAGTGSDTCGSLRIPAALQNLVSLRQTRGLSSRTGIAPLSSSQDVAGPLARSVTDLALLMDATVGPDRADPITAGASAHIPRSYRDSLGPDGLRGMRIGVVRALFEDEPEDEAFNEVINRSLEAMKAQGAEVFDVEIPSLSEQLADTSVILHEFKFDLADYLARHKGTPIGSLEDIISRGMEHYRLEDRLRSRNKPESRDTEAYRQALAKRSTLRTAVLRFLQEQRLDALAYPPVSRRSPFVDDDADDAGGADTCQLSASTGLPAIVFPAGFTDDGLPVGLELLGAA
ncbi:MAG: amidase, partial [Gammaproteobacteria bacterium]|nr:amidase [Gammaproteobacteria bacterium]